MANHEFLIQVSGRFGRDVTDPSVTPFVWNLFIMNQLANNYLFKNGMTKSPVCFSYPLSVIRESVNETS